MYACTHQLQQVGVAHLRHVCSEPGLTDEFLVGVVWVMVCKEGRRKHASPHVHIVPALTLVLFSVNLACSSSRRRFSSPTTIREYFSSSRRSVFPWSRSHSPNPCVARQSAVRKYIPTTTKTRRNSPAVRALMLKHQEVGWT